MLTLAIAPTLQAAETPPSSAGKTAPEFNPPYPDRANPFRLPDSKTALASRREAIVQQIDLKLKGFISVGSAPRAVIAIDGDVTTLGVGDRRGDIQVLEIAPPTLTLQRGRHRWVESLLDQSTVAGVKSP